MHPDALVEQVASRQHWVITREQLMACGLSRKAIAHRVKTRRLKPLYRGVFLVLHPVPPSGAREHAAVLACGDSAHLSDHSTAALLGIRPPHDGLPHVTVPPHRAPAPRGIIVHRRTLSREECTTREGIPITTAARTLRDIRRTLSRLEFEHAEAHAQILRLIPPNPATAFTRSEAERRMLQLIRRAGLPRPAVNARVEGFEVDFVWRAQRLIVEVDGYRYHSNRRAFERDRMRDQVLQAAGYRVLRTTWRQLAERPEELVARLAAALASLPRLFQGSP